MAKTKTPTPTSALSSIVEGMKSNFIGTFNKMVQEKIRKIEKMGVEIATGFIFFVFGVFFLLMAIVFYFHEWMNWGYFGSFLGTSVIALLACLTMVQLLKKN